MQILEDKAGWSDEFRDGWLAHWQATGAIDWKRYQHPRNSAAPGGPGIRLSESRLMLISSAGAYLRGSQPAFDAANDYGDYTLRTLPSSTPLARLAYAHGHYDPSMIKADPQVALPLRHLEALVAEGRVGELAPSVLSFMGYQPDAARVVDELVPQIVAHAQAEDAQAALLAPV